MQRECLYQLGNITLLFPHMLGAAHIIEFTRATKENLDYLYGIYILTRLACFQEWHTLWLPKQQVSVHGQY